MWGMGQRTLRFRTGGVLLMFGAGQPVSRLRGTEVDDGYGGTILDWTDPDILDLPRSALAPGAGRTILDDGRQGAEIVWTAYIPGTGHDITSADRLRIPAGTFQIDGEPQPWESPYTGRKPGTVVHLALIDG